MGAQPKWRDTSTKFKDKLASEIMIEDHTPYMRPPAEKNMYALYVSIVAVSTVDSYITYIVCSPNRANVEGGYVQLFTEGAHCMMLHVQPMSTFQFCQIHGEVNLPISIHAFNPVTYSETKAINRLL